MSVCPRILGQNAFTERQVPFSVGSDLNGIRRFMTMSSTMPPLPRGKSTILGGAIRDVDPVLDRFTLRIVGEKPIRILFDERTQVFLDGKKIPLRELRPSSHASVEDDAPMALRYSR